MYSPVQSLKALIPAVFTLALLGFSEQKRRGGGEGVAHFNLV